MVNSVPAPMAPTTDAALWDSHLATLLKTTSNPRDLAHAIHTHITTHDDVLIIDAAENRQLTDLLYKTWETVLLTACTDRSAHETLAAVIPILWELGAGEWEARGLEQYYALDRCILEIKRGGPCEPGAACNPQRNWQQHHDCDDDWSLPRNGNFAEKREGWINYCRFVALLDLAGVTGGARVFKYSMEGVLKDGTMWPTFYPNTAVLAFEQVMLLVGDRLWKRGGVWGAEGGCEGDALVRLWCDWERKLRAIGEDEGREMVAREAAQRIRVLMEGIRKENVGDAE